MTVRTELTRFLTEPDARRDPAPLYQALLRDAPVVSADGTGRLWVVAAHDAIVTIARDPGAHTEYGRAGIELGQVFSDADVLTKMLPLRSGADHSRLRRLASTAFSARSAATMRRRIDETVDRLLTPALATGEIELVSQIARPLPVAISCALMDIPADDTAQVASWAGLFVSAMREHTSPAALDDMRSYVTRLCAQRRRRPGDDIISTLVDAEERGVLDRDELFAFVVMLFVNGLETLTSGLAGGIWHMLQVPGLLGRIADGTVPAEAAFAESQRLLSPVRASARVLSHDIAVGDTTLPSGAAVILLFAAANLDPHRYPDPDRLDPFRAETRHLAFGYGPHHCLGAPVSIMAGAGVVRWLAEHCPDVRTTVRRGGPEWSTSLPFAGPTTLPLALTSEPARPHAALAGV